MKLFFKTFFLYVLAVSLAVGCKTKQAPQATTTPAPVQTVQQSVEKTYKYESVQGDPLNARIYTLDNGLKVYMTVYKDAPRIQTYFATRAGSKNDPADATGLAHYLEHMLFKGTDKYGSKDFAKEEPLIKQIEQLYEKYRKTTDEAQRKAMYRTIDSISGVAAKYAIANEYDKMLAAIGAQGTNAYTWVEQTVYVNDIPSNQLEKWLTIEAERFRNPVLRLFHTELEAVYEEKNRGLDSDGNKAFEALFAGLWPTHPYGTQTTIGTIDHLKNPSLTEINNYFQKYYVPNNMALCISGDFNPDETIKLIDKKFSNWKSKPVPAFNSPQEAPIAAPVVKEVLGPDAESVIIGFRFPGAGSKEADLLTLTNKILYNSVAGLIDLNLNQLQKVIDAGSEAITMKDYSTHILSANPKEGQKLEEVKDLLLGQIELIKKGDFPDDLLTAVINDLKLQQTKGFEQNSSRADAFVSAFILDQKWEDHVKQIERLSKISKQDVIDFTKKNYSNNYVVVYKRTGEDKNVKKVIKPAITPVEVNRNDQSPFLQEIVNAPISPIEPKFVDYKTDIQTLQVKNNIPFLYTQNKENNTFDLYYVFDMGSNHNKKLSVAIDYLPFLGTSRFSPKQIQQEFYKLGCSYNVFNSEDQVYVSLSGLNDNFEKALNLFEELLSDAQPNKEALSNLIDDNLKKREDAKLNKNVILRQAMYNYGVYGKTSPYTNILSDKELKSLKAEELIGIIKDLNSYEHRILYYGPLESRQVVQIVSMNHKAPNELKKLPEPTKFLFMETGNKVYVVDYPMKQAEIVMISKDETYNPANIPSITLFNEYFGGNMSSVVFQEMRESRALAYSVFSTYRTPTRKDRPHFVYSYIGTQADKLPEAMSGLTGLMNEMPESDVMFGSAKQSVLEKIRTERITKSDILFSYESAKKLGLDYDIRKDVYTKVQNMTMADVKAFQQNKMKNKPVTVLVLGDKKVLDLKTLEKYGKVEFLTLKDVFGY